MQSLEMWDCRGEAAGPRRYSSPFLVIKTENQRERERESFLSHRE